MDNEKTRVINTLGLQPRMPFLNRSLVSTYVRPSYRDSPEQERDEVHRMSEIILIHNESGVRVGCLVEEDYYGENVEYVIMSNFHIITGDGRNLNVLDVDMKEKLVTTTAGAIAFTDISREHE